MIPKNTLLLFSTMFFLSATCNAPARARIGVFDDGRAKAVDEIVKTLEEEGFQTGVIKSGRNTDFRDIYNYDVLYFSGGWGRYDWLTLDERMHLVEFVEQHGGGAVFSIFRCGIVGRSMIRPLFPEVAEAYTKSNSRGMRVVNPDHPVMAGLPETFLNPYLDHAIMRLGPQGIALALNSGGNTAMACGEAGRGRVVFLGPWIGIDNTGRDLYPMPENDRKLLLNSVAWAAGSPYRDSNSTADLSEATQLKVLRREKIIDWTHGDLHRNWRQGLLTDARNLREYELDILCMRLAKLEETLETTGAAAEIFYLKNKVAGLRRELRDNHARAVEERKLEISGMTLEQLKAEPVRDLSMQDPENDRAKIEALRGQLLFQYKTDAAEHAVGELEKQLAPEIEKHYELKYAAARAEDARNLPGLVSSLNSGIATERAAAALELARIGDPKTVDALISVLDDPDYETRKNAIYGLSWMQSNKAVAPLIKLLETSSHAPTRRRAAQALGQIGDPRAVAPLLKSVQTDADTHVRYNAILSLGWIGDPKAVRTLAQIAETTASGLSATNGADPDPSLEKSGKERASGKITITCVLMALARINAPELAVLMENPDIEAAMADIVKPGLGQEFFHTTDIKEGRGVSQPDFLRYKEHFYWMEGKYNAIYGSHTSWRYRPENPVTMLYYTAVAGGTAVVSFNTTDEWTARYPNIGLDSYFDKASKLGIKINTQIPTLPEVMNKALLEREITRLSRHKSFGGLWGEENLNLEAWARTGGNRDFQKFLAARYSMEKLAELGIEDLSEITIPKPDSGSDDIFDKDGARADKVLFAEYMEHIAEKGTDNWREAVEWAAGLRKGAKFMFSAGARYDRGSSAYISAYPEISTALNAAGPQSHSEHSSLNNFKLDLQVDGEPRPTCGEFFAHLTDTISRMERGFASTLVYGQQFFNRISPRPGLWWWTHGERRSNESMPDDILYDRARLEAAARQFRKAAVLKQYLAPRETSGAGLVTQLYSGRTTTLTYGDGTVDGFNRGSRSTAQTPRNYPFRYTQDQQALWESLIRSHLPVEMTWLETQRPEKLAGYKVAILANAASIDDSEAEMIREWVENGGTLIATASATLHDRWDRKQDNYSLADVFGLNYARTEGKPGLAYLERDLKPETGISEIRITAPEYFLHMEGAVSAEYEKAAGYDVIEPVTARVVGVWADDQTPVVLENRFGKGNVIFIAARYPALSHSTRDWIFNDLYKTYWPGARELIAACVRRALLLAGAKPPVLVRNCPETVEVRLKRQEQNNRWIVHLLNIDAKNGIIDNVKMTISAGKNVKSAYYAYPEKNEIEFEQADDEISFTVRPFDIHEIIVVEF